MQPPTQHPSETTHPLERPMTYQTPKMISPTTTPSVPVFSSILPPHSATKPNLQPPVNQTRPIFNSIRYPDFSTPSFKFLNEIQSQTSSPPLIPHSSSNHQHSQTPTDPKPKNRFTGLPIPRETLSSFLSSDSSDDSSQNIVEHVIQPNQKQPRPPLSLPIKIPSTSSDDYTISQISPNSPIHLSPSSPHVFFVDSHQPPKSTPTSSKSPLKRYIRSTSTPHYASPIRSPIDRILDTLRKKRRTNPAPDSVLKKTEREQSSRSTSTPTRPSRLSFVLDDENANTPYEKRKERNKTSKGDNEQSWKNRVWRRPERWTGGQESTLSELNNEDSSHDELLFEQYTTFNDDRPSDVAITTHFEAAQSTPHTSTNSEHTPSAPHTSPARHIWRTALPADRKERCCCQLRPCSTTRPVFSVFHQHTDSFGLAAQDTSWTKLQRKDG
ncbi:hypothetical protein BLNAU_23270 [Blattamonas nauphoetae]|uniref:Uncharacterized protein n=1 Tax=Blattamonas nauphoetae TaxID=2049346 RepID=A0ABQ9WUV3_9EUKA|nr:hypothetical protein BLNAU_23270 [Blattamonas nauphoetae]